MTIEESLARLAPHIGWLRFEVCDSTAQDFLGHSKPCYAALSLKLEIAEPGVVVLKNPVVAYGDSLPEALEELVTKVEEKVCGRS